MCYVLRLVKAKRWIHTQKSYILLQTQQKKPVEKPQGCENTSDTEIKAEATENRQIWKRKWNHPCATIWRKIRVIIQSLLNWVFLWGGLSVSRPCHFAPSTERLGGCVGPEHTRTGVPWQREIFLHLLPAKETRQFPTTNQSSCHVSFALMQAVSNYQTTRRNNRQTS
jgi:hypothetical protein